MKSKMQNNRFLEIVPIKSGVEEKGKRLSISYSYVVTDWGEMLIASTTKGICYLAFLTALRDALDELKQLFPDAILEERKDAIQEKAIYALNALDSEEVPQIILHIKGTDFQLKVWRELLNIPWGSITSYRNIAESLGDSNASRAVGTAVGKNPVSVLIPCHRVLRKDGGLGGYHWGLDRKEELLRYEGYLK